MVPTGIILLDLNRGEKYNTAINLFIFYERVRHKNTLNYLNDRTLFTTIAIYLVRFLKYNFYLKNNVLYRL